MDYMRRRMHRWLGRHESICLLIVFLCVGAGSVCANGVHEKSGEPLAFRLYGYIHPLGIAAYSSLWITFMLGLLKFKFHVKKFTMKWHYGFAILTIILATLHLSLVLYIEYH
jgi:hypothetical protein